MDDVSEAAVLAATQQIIDDEAAVGKLMALFGLGHRQAENTLHQIRRNATSSARRRGMALEEYVEQLSEEQKLALYGFSAGVVCQKDWERGRDPETGEPRPGPEYSI